MKAHLSYPIRQIVGVSKPDSTEISIMGPGQFVPVSNRSMFLLLSAGGTFYNSQIGGMYIIAIEYWIAVVRGTTMKECVASGLYVHRFSPPLWIEGFSVRREKDLFEVYDLFDVHDMREHESIEAAGLGDVKVVQFVN